VNKSKSDIQDQFHSLFSADNKINITEVLLLLLKSGLQEDDPRLLDFFQYLKEADLSEFDELPLDQIKDLKDTASVLDKVLCGGLIISDFSAFTEKIAEIFYTTRANDKGDLATYIPQLAKVDPDKFGLSVCTIDGQRFSLGDSGDKFALQSASKPITYALALEEHGEEYVHKHVGKEPSGMAFNGLTLNKDGLPHNPMINAGAIMSCSLIKKDSSVINRFEYIMKSWARLTTGAMPNLNQSIYFSEKDTADRNYAICYLMREQGAFPDHVNIQGVINLYFQCCSLELNCDELSIAAATLAHTGINPLTNERVFKVDTVKDTLSLMSTCGMYDFSGEFFFTVGIPCKSGVSGVLMLIVPNVMGIAIYSPRLDSFGNSVRGVEFCKRLVEIFNFHGFDGGSRFSAKIDPTRREFEIELEKSILLCSAASRNSVLELQRLSALGVDLNLAGYDGRTAIHYAASEGANEVIKYLMQKNVNLEPVDRWGNTPLDDARREDNVGSINLLQQTKKRI
jgi:glutaminase